jgi:hypothetical protein
VTVRVKAGLVTPLSDAVITLVPTARVEASPVLLTVATVGVADAQVTELVTFCVEPLARVAVAVSCRVRPLARVGLLAEIAMDCTATLVRIGA